MDVMAEFGLKMEDDAKKATRPNEHNKDVKAEENGHSENAEASQTDDKSNEKS